MGIVPSPSRFEEVRAVDGAEEPEESETMSQFACY